MRSARWLPALLGTAAALLLAGCSGTAVPADPATTAATVTSTVGTITAPASTVTSIVPGNTITAQPPPSTPEPPPTAGECPYLATDEVAEINGQRAGGTQVIDLQPQPMCVFYRSDGGWLASIRIITADTAQAAVAAVDQHVPIDGSDPASQPPGWTGGSMVTDNGSVYAVSKGNVAVVAESNQQQSIKGRQMVIKAVANLGL